MKSGLARRFEQFGVTQRTRDFLAQRKGHFIANRWITDGEQTDILDPVCGEVLCTVPEGTVEYVDQAVTAARCAFEEGEWSQWSPVQRERLLQRLADLVEGHRQTLAEIEALDAGKAIEGCKAVDIDGAIDLLRYMAGWATKVEGATKSVSVPGDHFAYTLKRPIGVVGAIVPWNWPFNMAIWKLAAPLAVGCTIVIKPAQITPLSMLFFMELCLEAGMPPGVINLVLGRGSVVGDALANHPGINKMSFTGSTEVGKSVGKAAVGNLNPVTLELGGKSPMVVFPDANREKVVAATQQSVFFNTGQVCSAGSRIYLHEQIYDSFVQAIAARAEAMVVGDTLDPATDMGPAISELQRNLVQDYIDLGVREGARLVTGGRCDSNSGYWLRPTVFAECRNDMRIVQEEIFGPVLVAIPFSDEDEVVSLANDNIYGLGASVFTQDISLAHRMVERLQAGTVWVNTHDLIDANTPFGGVKASGFGKDLGPEQLDHYLVTKAVWIEL